MVGAEALEGGELVGEVDAAGHYREMCCSHEASCGDASPVCFQIDPSVESSLACPVT